MKILLKTIATLFATGLAFCSALFATVAVLDRWYVPKMVEKYPHDGQIGLAVFVYSLNTAIVCAVATFVLGIVWTIKTSRAKPPVG